MLDAGDLQSKREMHAYIHNHYMHTLKVRLWFKDRMKTRKRNWCVNLLFAKRWGFYLWRRLLSRESVQNEIELWRIWTLKRQVREEEWIRGRQFLECQDQLSYIAMRNFLAPNCICIKGSKHCLTNKMSYNFSHVLAMSLHKLVLHLFAITVNIYWVW